ncbi:MAG: FAD-dependent oxidoreductase, partial [Acidobacteriota bacterium]|nr:FAD-dependent oxidoreductase [Acidobacteriota bacterium]
LSSGEARALLPPLRAPVAGALLYADEAHCDPGRFVNVLLEAARGLGAEIRGGVEVLGFETAAGRVSALQTTGGRVTGATIVLAAGAWTQSLARELGLTLPLEGGKGYHLELPAGSADALPCFFEEARITATPLDGRLRVTGMLDLAGLDMTVDPRALATIDRAARRLLRLGPEVQPSRLWRGLRPCSPDGLPVIGRFRRYHNLLIATAHAMLGIALAPATAAIISDLIAERAPRFEIEPFSPERFRQRVL